MKATSQAGIAGIIYIATYVTKSWRLINILIPIALSSLYMFLHVLGFKNSSGNDNRIPAFEFRGVKNDEWGTQ